MKDRHGIGKTSDILIPFTDVVEVESVVRPDHLMLIDLIFGAILRKVTLAETLR